MFLNQTRINLSTNIKYLEIIINKYLNFKDHLNYIESKFAQAVGILYKCKNVFLLSILRMLYFSLFYPHITYGIAAWGSTYSSFLHRIQILQNKAIRAITDVGFQQELTPIYSQLEILKLKNVHTLALGKFMQQYLKASLPSSLLYFP